MQAASCGSASELYRQSGASKALLCSDLAILRHNIRLSLLHCVRQHFDVVSCCFQDFAACRVAMCTMWRPKISTPCRHWLAVLPANSWLVIRTRWLCSLPPNCGLPHASQGPLIHTACRPHRGREVPPAGRGQSAAGGQALTRAPRAAAHSCSGSRWSPGIAMTACVSGGMIADLLSFRKTPLHILRTTLSTPTFRTRTAWQGISCDIFPNHTQQKDPA